VSLTTAMLAAVVARYSPTPFRDTVEHMACTLAAGGVPTGTLRLSAATPAAATAAAAGMSMDAFTALVTGACDACF